ncbi:MAG: ABC transporter permease [Christensenellaceae bacterium]
MVKLKSCLKWLFVGLIVLFIYAPILLLTVYSFNETERITSWKGFSLEHYKYFFSFDHEPLPIVLQTLLLAGIVATLSTLFEPSAYRNLYSKTNTLDIVAVNQIPIINAEVVTVMSFSSSSSLCTSIKHLYSLVWDKWFCVPLSVMPKLKQMDNNLYEGSRLELRRRKHFFRRHSANFNHFRFLRGRRFGRLRHRRYTKPNTFETISTHIYGLTKGQNVNKLNLHWALQLSYSPLFSSHIRQYRNL